MKIDGERALKDRSEREAKFMQAIRGVDDSAIEHRVPKTVQFITNEMSLLGEDFFRKTLEISSVCDENNSKSYIHHNF
jgi:hypothetical protein